MKKLVSILAIALALCMLCAWAMADDSVKPIDELSRVHTIDGHEVNSESYKIVKEPTCADYGVARYDCLEGAHFHELFIDKVDHTWGDWSIPDEEFVAKCEEDVTREHTCEVCGEVETETLEALGHAWSSESGDEKWGIIDQEPTCTDDGSAYDYCTRCDIKHLDDDGNEIRRPIQALGHDYRWVTDKQPTCQEEGHRYQLCRRCGEQGEEETIAKIDHIFAAAEWQEPNCMNGLQPSYVSKCTMCGIWEDGRDGEEEADWENEEFIHTDISFETYLRRFPDWQDTHDKDGHAWFGYTTTGYPNYISKNTEWTKEEEPEYSCMGYTAVRACSICAEKQEKEFADKPVWKLVEDKTRLIDCYEKEYTYICSVCEGEVEGHSYKETERLETSAHEYVIVETVPATCTEPGYITWRCSHYDEDDRHLNDETAERTDEYEAVGHTVEDWVERFSGDGYTYYLGKCLACDTFVELLVEEGEPSSWTLQEDLSEEATCDENGIEVYWDGETVDENGEPVYHTYIIEATGHDWEVTVAGDCETDKVEVCKNCGAEQVTPAAGEHTWDEQILTDSDCENAGEGVRTCSVCGKVEKYVIEPKGHNYATEPGEPIQNCEIDGGTTDKIYCTVCGYVAQDHEEIPAPGSHNYKLIAEVPATCSAEGTGAYMECTVCGYVPIPAATIAKLPHTEETIPGYPADCTTAGLTDGVICSVCEEVLVEQEVIPAENHNGVQVEGTPATCTTDGLTAGVQCSKCKEWLVPQTVIPATDHSYVAEITKEATPDEDGIITHTCENCGDSFSVPYAFEATEDPAYELVDMAYEHGKLTGSVYHDPYTTESARLYVRVTVFFTNGTYGIFNDIVEDGIISTEIVGDVDSIGIELTGSRAINPGTYTIFDSYGIW